MTACTRDSGVTLPDFIRIGEAFDLPTIKIDKKDNLDEQIQKVLKME